MALSAYCALSIVLMLSDKNSGISKALREHTAELLQPVWWLAAAPKRAYNASIDYFRTGADLRDENAALREEIMLANTRMRRLSAVSAENQRLRRLLGGTAASQLKVQLVDIQQVDLSNTKQRLLLAAGANNGVQVGQAVVDADGLLGQVIQVNYSFSTALLITDSDHSVPVLEARTGLRLIAYGTGESRSLRVPNIPQSAQLKVGDVLISSGVGGRFPPGFPVAIIERLEPDETRSFVQAYATPAAHVDQGGEVLLVKDLRPLSSPKDDPVPVPAQTPDATAPAENSAGNPASATPAANNAPSTALPSTSAPVTNPPKPNEVQQ
jgi:rod shape-determining protein MreC